MTFTINGAIVAQGSNKHGDVTTAYDCGDTIVVATVSAMIPEGMNIRVFPKFDDDGTPDRALDFEFFGNPKKPKKLLDAVSAGELFVDTNIKHK